MVGEEGMGRPLLVRAAVRRDFGSRMGREERLGVLARGERLGQSGGLECPGYWEEWGAVPKQGRVRVLERAPG